MKKILPLLIVVLLFTACDSSSKEKVSIEQPQNVVDPYDTRELSLVALLDNLFAEKVDIDLLEKNSWHTCEGEEKVKPDGRWFDFDCKDLLVEGISRDLVVYEGHEFPAKQKPYLEEALEWCSGEGSCKSYQLGSLDFFVMDNFWGFDPGEKFWLSAYVPVENDAIYSTVRFSMPLEFLPEMYDSNNENDPTYQVKVSEYLQKIIDKDLFKSTLEKVNDFEALLSSLVSD